MAREVNNKLTIKIDGSTKSLERKKINQEIA